MKQLYCILIMFGMVFGCLAQFNRPNVRYLIEATLNPNRKTIDGQWEATYVNKTDSVLHSIWLILYPNAFATDKTNYSEELLRWGKTDYYFGKEEDRGWIDSLNFTINGINANWTPKEEHPEHINLLLDQPLQSGDSIHISTTFFTQIPFNFDKEGYSGDNFFLSVWCPLIADLNSTGWQLRPYSTYLNNTTALASYRVHINLPKNYLIKTNGSQVAPNTFEYEGTKGFQYIISKDKAFFQNHSLDNGNQDSIKVAIAKHIFPSVFNMGRAPENPSLWLGQVYKKYQRSVPFLQDSFYYQNDTGLNASKKMKLGFLYDFRHTDQYKYVFVSPALGFNNYDKVMVGALVHNYQLPQQPFSFAIAPMYATESKRFAGWGQMDYNIWKPTMHWQLGLTGSTASWRKFDIADYPKLYQRYWRIVPSINLTILDKEAISTRQWNFGVRSYILSQQNYKMFTSDNDTSFGNVTTRTNFFNLAAKLQDTRELYPYSLSLATDVGKEFLKLALTGKYFFNYNATNRGVSARFFAGKFFYLKNKNSLVEANNQTYNFNLSGPSGIYDYTYSDYFVGRNESRGWMSQQIMERDGFFKIPTTRINGGVFGLSDDWLTALNLNVDIPKRFDFLQYIGGSLKLFFDVGTFSDLWSDEPPADRFLYDAGVQVSLFKSLVNLYVPVIYSHVYKDKIPADNRFWKTVSFNINLSAITKFLQAR